MVLMKKMSVSKFLSFPTMLFLVFFSFFKLSSCSGNRCPDIEKQALLSFKEFLHDPHNSFSSWSHDKEVNCCEWNGVRCSNLTGHVDQLDLHFRELGGKVSHSLFNLKHLKYLDLSGNYFIETIPPFIGSLTSLEYLDLSFAKFYGKIPYTIGNLSNLHTLIFRNDYPLEVDSLEWLARLSKLEYLDMNGVDLSRVSDWQQQVINKLPSLVELHLSRCNLNSTSPLSDVSNNNITSSNLAYLDLSARGENFQITSPTPSILPIWIFSENSRITSPTPSILPKWIFRLGNLKHLRAYGNNYEGPIPTASNTTKLQSIVLSLNHLNSSIPEWLYFLKDLEYLSLQENNLQDAISNSIANMTSLVTLDLHGNKLSGNLPRGFTKLCKLQTLKLDGNKLQGGVSDLLGNVSACFLGSLETLDLSDNQLSGPLPHQFGEFKSLRSLDLSHNKFTGNLPESIGQLSSLVTLRIENNMLTGVVSETHFANLSGLQVLFASQNNLTLKVGPNWIPPFKLLILYLGSWNIGSRIPSWLETQKTSIGVLDLSNTGIYGNVPDWLWEMRFLNLSNNKLHGKIPVIRDPPEFRNSFQLMSQFFYLGSNKFSGKLPLVGEWLIDLDLSKNSFSGDLSQFLCNTSAYRLKNLQLEGNQLTGELPSDCFTEWSSLHMLNLGNNNLSGTIPSSIGFLESLKSLNLYGNNFSGSIPLSMLNCIQLLKIDLSHNNISGNLPKQIVTSLSQLVILILKSNKLNGQITSSICQLSSLQILDLSDNMFFGMIPTCVDNFTAMITTKRSAFTLSYCSSNVNVAIEYASIFTKGMKLTYDNTLFLVTSIDLSNNNLSGDIPKEITSLVELRTLNLFGNHLTGMIPHSIGNMTQLESLDLSINSLSGELPNSFRIMSTLNYLNVSYNKLTGRIPQSTQFCSFNESSFIGNNLSGPPLTGSCTSSTYNVGKVPVTKHSLDGEGDKPEIEWFYVLISLGYAIGLSGFLTTIFLKRSWREAYFESIENVWDSAYVYLHIIWRKLKGAFQYA